MENKFKAKTPFQKKINNNIIISKLGLGTVKFGRNTGVKYPKSFELPTDSEILELLELALELGINTIDTAPAYGSSQDRLGKLLNMQKDKREKLTIISKAGEDFRNNQSHYDFSASNISKSLDNTLKTLNTNYLDIFLIHSDGNDLEIAKNDKLWQLLEKRKQQGDIKSFGVSSKTKIGGLECLKRSDIAMIELNDDYTELLNFAEKNNKNIILKKIFNSGHLENSFSIIDALKKSFKHPAIDSAIIGTINKNHLKENITQTLNLIN